MRIRRRWVILALVVCLGVGLGWWRGHYVLIGGRSVPRDARALTLSHYREADAAKLGALTGLEDLDVRGTGLTLPQYRQLSGMLPGCRIQWDVPFQGDLLPQSTRELTLTSLSMEEVETLTCLENLTQVDARECGDYEALAALSRAMPQCQVAYRVPIGGNAGDSLEETLHIQSSDLSSLREALPLLPGVKKVVISGSLPENGEILSLESDFPEVLLTWRLGERALPLGQGVEYLDLRGEALTLAQARGLLTSCPDLRRGDLTDCGLTTEEMLALCEEFPHCTFTWNITFGDRVYPSDAEEIDLTGLPLEDTRWLEARVQYMPRLKKVLLIDCGLESETLEELNQRYETIQFVWTVTLGPITLRTDAEFFAPVVTGDHVNQSQVEALKYCHDLVAIDLGHMPVTDCSWAAGMPKLKYLILAETGVRDLTPLASCGELVFLELFLSPARDYSPLLACKKLEDLNLCYCRGSAESVRQMTWLKRLWWDGNETQTRGLAKALPDTQCNFTSGSSTGGTWRKGQRYKEQRDILGMPYMVG